MKISKKERAYQVLQCRTMKKSGKRIGKLNSKQDKAFIKQ